MSGDECKVMSGDECIVVSGDECIVVSGDESIAVPGDECIVLFCIYYNRQDWSVCPRPIKGWSPLSL